MALIYVDDVFVNESALFVDFTVRLDAPSSQAIAVQYSMSNVTASTGFDYTAASGTLNFGIGEVSKTIRVELRPDSTVERTEVFRLNLANPVNATLADTSALAYIFDNDAPLGRPAVSISDATLDEGGGSMQFVVTLSRPSSSTVTVSYTPASGTATAGADFAAAGGNLTFAPGEVMKTIAIPIVNDTIAEGNEQFTVVLSSAGNADLGRSIGIGTIGASDQPAQLTLRISVWSPVVSEGDEYVEYVVQLSAPSSQIVTVSFANSNMTASTGFDYLARSGTIAFNIGETTRVIRVPLLDDTTVERDEWLSLALSNPTNAVLGNAIARTLLVDNDAPAGAPNIAIGDAVVDESDGYAWFHVTLDRPFASTLTVSYATANGTAAAGADYLARTGTISFAPGQMVQSIPIPIVNDTAPEPDELFTVVLSGPSGGELARPVGTGLIGRNDGTPSASPIVSSHNVVVGEADQYAEFVVQLSAPSEQVVSVGYSNSNVTASTGFDYVAVSGTLVFEPGQTTKFVRVPVLDDTTAEQTEHFHLRLTSAVNATLGTDTYVASIVDNDAGPGQPAVYVNDAYVDESDGVARFTVTLDRPTGSILTVDYSTIGYTAVAGADFVPTSGTLRFAPGVTAQTVLVPLIDDRGAEPDEIFYFQLSNPSFGTLGDANGVGLIGRNDLASVASPTISARMQDTGENEPYVDVMVQLSAPSRQVVTVNYSNSNVTASTGFDYVARSDTLVFAPGQTTQIVRIPILNDTTVEQIETFRFNLTGATNATIPAANTPLTISIADNNSGPTVSQLDFGVFSAIKREGNGNDAFLFEVERRGDLAQSAAVNWSISAGSVNGADFVGGVLPSGRLQFAPGESAKLVSVEIAGDTTLERHEDILINLSGAFNASIWKSQVSALLENDDRAPLAGPPAYGQNGTFMFDPAFYLWRYPELAATVPLEQAVNHYLGGGATTRDPNSYFDATYYKNRWPDLTPLNLDNATLFLHFNLYGVWEGRSPGPKFELFDGNRYLTDNPDVAAYVDAFVNDFLGSRTNGAIAHYIIYGAAEQRQAFDLNGGAMTLDYLWL